MTTFPQNEEQTIQLFRLIQNRIGWHIVHLQTAFPDAVIENGQGQRLVVEFEFNSKNFHAHGHDPAGCDLIVCWHDAWENPPVPVWALEGCAKGEAKIIRDIIGLTVSVENYVTVCKEVMERDNEIRALKKQVGSIPRKSGASKLPPTFIKVPVPIQMPAKDDWILALIYFALGVGFWALHPFILGLIGTL